MVQLNFDASQVAPSAPPEALETGWYPANITMTEMKPNSKGTGAYLEISHRISAGPATGRTLKARLNLQNPNQQTVDIAYQELSAICHAVGRLRVGTSQELHGGACEIFVKKVARQDQPDVMTNDVAGWRAAGAQGNQPGFTQGAGSQAGAAPSWAAPQAPAPAPQQYAPQPAPQTWGQPPAQQPAPQPAPNNTAPWAAEKPPAAAPQNFAPQPQAQPAPAAATAATGSVPPWAQ